MSLDVYLHAQKNVQNSVEVERIFIREHGSNREISRAEWDALYPDREPVTVCDDSESDVVYSANITHNLTTIADRAGIYEALWRPEEIHAQHACAIIPLLQEGLRVLKETPEWFKKFNPPNGWGDYEGFVSFVEKYLEACERYPDAMIGVSR